MRTAVETARWWRFSRYEIVAGVVRPSAGAEAEEYDPWQLYTSGRRRGQHGDRIAAPYQDLVNLGCDVRKCDVDGSYSNLDLRQEKRLLKWCRTYGLLGLWHHEVLLALFPDGPQSGAGGALRGYERAPSGWREIRARTGPVRRDQEVHGLRLPDELLAGFPHEVWRTSLPSGGFVIRELPNAAISHVGLDPMWRLHFHADGALGRPAWPIPSPKSIEFWQAYGEPVSMIAFAALEMAAAVEHLASVGKGMLLARDGLNRLAAPSSPALVKNEGGWTQGWSSPSLLATLAAMAITDAAGGARSAVCLACGAPFLTQAYQARYCSSRCKETARTRRRRAKDSD